MSICLPAGPEHLTDKISIIDGRELDDDLARAWQALALTRPDLGSPFYQPGFARIVARQNLGVRLALIEQQGQLCGVFPFHRDRWGRLRSVGYQLNDYHGLVLRQGVAIDATQLLRACDARYFAFDHMPLTQATFAPHVALETFSPVMELEGGIEAYRQRLSARSGKGSSGIFQSVGNARRRLERQVGPLRLEMACKDPRAYQRLLALKSRQFITTTGGNPLELPWMRGALDDVFACDEGVFGGMLSVLYAGDHMVALHLGMRHRDQCHVWFITYDPEFAAYSPGLVLLMGMAEAAQAHGFSLLDLGRGSQPYKARFQTSSIALGEGAVSRPQWVSHAVLAHAARKRWLKTTILGQVWRTGKRWFHRAGH